MDAQRVRCLVEQFPIASILPGMSTNDLMRLAAERDPQHSGESDPRSLEQLLIGARDAAVALELLKTRMTWLSGYAYRELAAIDPQRAEQVGTAWQMAPAITLCEELTFEESGTAEGWQKSRTLS